MQAEASRAGGSIVFTSGIAGQRPHTGWALGASVTSAMEGVELAPIRVNIVSPGVVKTPLWSAMPEADREALYRQMEQNLLVGHVGELEEIAEAYLYLMRQTYSTGQVDERRVARRKSGRGDGTDATPLTPTDIERRYAFPPGDAAGQVIGIAEFGGGYFPDDVAAFCDKYERAVPSVTVEPVGLRALTPAQIRRLPPQRRNDELGASTEVMMDVEIIAALCPASSIGSGDQMADGRAHVDFPSCSPSVLSVGGTMLSGSTEVVWWEAPGQRTPNGGGATGGGVSVFLPRPSWQTIDVRSLNAGSIDGRVIPDVAAVAGAPFYDLIFQGQGHRGRWRRRIGVTLLV
jgi:subtilase family serine protease